MPRNPKTIISRFGKPGTPSGDFLNVYRKTKGGRTHSIISIKSLKIGKIVK